MLLYCIMLYCIVMYCNVLHCIVLSVLRWEDEIGEEERPLENVSFILDFSTSLLSREEYELNKWTILSGLLRKCQKDSDVQYYPERLHSTQ